MEIIIGENSGFCFGVKRAINGVEKQLENYCNLMCLGELVHNESVIKNLEKKGVIFVNDISQVKNGSKLAIRAHGIPKKVYKEAKDRNIELLDYTCPKVLKIHDLISKKASEGYDIILLGDKTHPEVIGSRDYADNIYVIDSTEQIEKLPKLSKVFVVAQTTFSFEKYIELEKKLKNKYDNLESVNTICQTTKIRQDECKKIAEKSDFMIIVGGKNSSNTHKLFDIASSINNNCIIIQDENDKKIGECKKYDIIGIMSGASTPIETVNNIVKKIWNYSGVK